MVYVTVRSTNHVNIKIDSLNFEEAKSMTKQELKSLIDGCLEGLFDEEEKFELYSPSDHIETTYLIEDENEDEFININEY